MESWNMKVKMSATVVLNKTYRFAYARNDISPRTYASATSTRMPRLDTSYYKVWHVLLNHDYVCVQVSVFVRVLSYVLCKGVYMYVF